MPGTLFAFNEDGLHLVDEPLYQLSQPVISMIQKNYESIKELIGIRPIAENFELEPEGEGTVDMIGVGMGGRLAVMRFDRPEGDNPVVQAIFEAECLSGREEELASLYQERYGETIELDGQDPLVICLGAFSDADLCVAEQSKRHIILYALGLVSEEVIMIDHLYDNRIAEADDQPGEQEDDEAAKLPSLKELDEASDGLKRLYYDLKGFISELGDDALFIPRKFYFSFKRKTSLAEIFIRNRDNKLSLRVKVDREYIRDLEMEEGFLRDISTLGYGRLEISVHNRDQLKQAKQILLDAYRMDGRN